MDVNRAYNLYIMIVIHLVTIVINALFIVHIIKNAKKNIVFKKFIVLQSIIMLWVLSKVIKAISPTVTIRWIAVIIQYISVAFLGYAFIQFAYVFFYNKSMKKIVNGALMSYPISVFLIVITNPLHQLFFTSFTLTRLKFGPLFFIHSYMSYVYIFVGLILFIRSALKYRKQYRRSLAIILFSAPLIPYLVNILYVLNVLRPFFDMTPIAFSFSNLAYGYAIFRYGFLDIPRVAVNNVIREYKNGIILADHKGTVIFNNEAAITIAGNKKMLNKLIKNYQINKKMEQEYNQRWIKITGKAFGLNYTLFRIKDITTYKNTLQELEEKNAQMIMANEALALEIENRRKLMTSKEKVNLAREIHDEFGHNFTLLIHMLELLLITKEDGKTQERIIDIRGLIKEQKHKLEQGFEYNSKFTVRELSMEINQFKDRYKKINVDINIHNKSKTNIRLTDEAYLALIRICQEALTNAVKHGNAKNIDVFFKDKAHHLEVYIIDDGIGCQKINKGFGITEMSNRVVELGGHFSCSSNENEGFVIYLKIPLISTS